MPLTVTALGPFTRGAIAAANSSLDMRGAARFIRHAVLSGEGRLQVGNGSEVAITLMDDQGSPAACTSVCEIISFADYALAVGHSTVTDKAYLYRLDASLTGYYTAAGVFHAGATAVPAHVLWTSMANPPVVTIAEVLGQAYIAATNALSATAFAFQTWLYTGSAISTCVVLTANLGTGSLSGVYFLGVFSFHGHLFGWGYDKGAVSTTAWRPELLRHGGPDGASLDTDGNGTFTVGHRIQSARERIVGVCVAGDVAYVGTTYALWPIVGYGRDTWDKSRPLDDSYGFLCVKGAVSANGVCYYWSPRGPARVSGLNKPEPLWDPLADVVPTIVDPHRIVAAYDADADQVLWYYRAGEVTGNQLIAAYDVRRGVMLGPDTDAGIQVACAGLVAPITAPDEVPSVTAPGPIGAPTAAFTSFVGATIAFAGWTLGATGVGVTTLVELRVQGTPTWASLSELSGDVESAALYGLTPSTSYEWRVAHRKNGQSSAYLGPSAATQFATAAKIGGIVLPDPIVGTALLPPTGLVVVGRGPAHSPEALVRWTNSGEADVSTEVTMDGVSVGVFSPGVASAQVNIDTDAVYVFAARHLKPGFAPSAFTADYSIFLYDCPR